MKKTFITIFLLLFMCTSAFAFNVSLQWSHPDGGGLPGPEVQGYEVCFGEESRNYTVFEFAGDGTNYVVNGLPDGTMHYFSVRTLGWNGRVSEYSNEVRTDGINITGDLPSAPSGLYILEVTP